MIGHARRIRNYRIQNNQNHWGWKPTPAQKRRARKKLGHGLAKKGVSHIQTVKGI